MQLKTDAVKALIAAQHNCPVEQIQLDEPSYDEATGHTFNYCIIDGDPDPVAGYLPYTIQVNLYPTRVDAEPFGEADDENYALEA